MEDYLSDGLYLYHLDAARGDDPASATAVDNRRGERGFPPSGQAEVSKSGGGEVRTCSGSCPLCLGTLREFLEVALV